MIEYEGRQVIKAYYGSIEIDEIWIGSILVYRNNRVYINAYAFIILSGVVPITKADGVDNIISGYIHGFIVAKNNFELVMPECESFNFDIYLTGKIETISIVYRIISISFDFFIDKILRPIVANAIDLIIFYEINLKKHIIPSSTNSISRFIAKFVILSCSKFVANDCADYKYVKIFFVNPIKYVSNTFGDIGSCTRLSIYAEPLISGKITENTSSTIEVSIHENMTTEHVCDANILIRNVRRGNILYVYRTNKASTDESTLYIETN